MQFLREGKYGQPRDHVSKMRLDYTQGARSLMMLDWTQGANSQMMLDYTQARWMKEICPRGNNKVIIYFLIS